MGVCGAVVVVWLLVLPAVCRTAAFRERSRFLEERGVDASAMFYTELDNLPRVMRHMDRLRAAHPELFWPSCQTPGVSNDQAAGEMPRRDCSR